MKQNKMISVLAFFMLSVLSQAFANTTDDSLTTLPVELKLVGTIDDNPLLQLNFLGSNSENEFSISISDEEGIVLYSGKEKGEVISKKFLLKTEELGDAVLRFVITGKKSGQTAVYQVSTHRRVIEQMDLVKL
ncbi:MAG: hypothetical protein ABIW38_06615 [Ferruginibacter sp.]